VDVTEARTSHEQAAHSPHRGPGRHRLPILLIAVLAVGQLATAEEPVVRVSVIASGEVTLSGDVEASVRPAADLEVEGPLPIGARSIAMVSTRVRIFGLPGESVSLVDPKTFRAAEVSLGLSRPIGHVQLGGGEEVLTSVAAEWGFATVPGSDPAPALRYPRHYALGLRFEERRGGARLDLKLGRHEAAGQRGYGQLLLEGKVPLKKIRRVTTLLGGDAVLSVGPASARAGQRDALRLWVGVALRNR
jgi:hypothetical protein